MKCLQRCCCLLCALVLSSIAFSLNVHAKDESPTNYTVTHKVSVYKNGSLDAVYDMLVDPNDNLQTYLTYSDYNLVVGNTYKVQHSYKINTKELPLISKGNTATITLHNAYWGVGYNFPNGFGYNRLVDYTSLYVNYIDGGSTYGTLKEYKTGTGTISITYDVDVLKNVDYVEFHAFSKAITVTQNTPLTVYLGEVSGADMGFNMLVEQLSEEGGLIKDVGNKITDLKDSLVSKFNSLIDNITELPSKLWNLISNGLKDLFVPDEEFIVQYKEDMDSMLENKLGAVYQVSNITLESWDRIGASDEQNTIQLPETTINLPDNNKFSFGGYDVKIVPDGFEVLSDAIKLIGGICITILFVNGLRKRYDEVMGVEK